MAAVNSTERPQKPRFRTDGAGLSLDRRSFCYVFVGLTGGIADLKLEHQRGRSLGLRKDETTSLLHDHRDLSGKFGSDSRIQTIEKFNEKYLITSATLESTSGPHDGQKAKVQRVEALRRAQGRVVARPTAVKVYASAMSAEVATSKPPEEK